MSPLQTILMIAIAGIGVGYIIKQIIKIVQIKKGTYKRKKKKEEDDDE